MADDVVDDMATNMDNDMDYIDDLSSYVACLYKVS